MELYTLDSLYRRERVIDKFESLIWTERFSSIGDFQLSLQSTPENRNLLQAGTLLTVNESYRVMEVETIEDKNDTDGSRILTVQGRSLEKVMAERLARNGLSDLTTTPKWSITELPGNIARHIFTQICMLGVVDSGDIIPSIVDTSIFPVDTIPEPTDTITYEFDPMTVYQAIKDLCDIYDLGFRIVLNPNTNLLHFDVYSGSDRTTGQDDIPAVIFSPSFDNLKNTTEVNTIALAKNVAYVLSPVGHEVVYPLDVDPSVAGFDRRALFIKADDITDEDPEVASARMIQRGKEELARSRSLSAFDGELSQISQYKYGRDYNLGDLVEKRNDEGVVTNMRVVEQIFVSDKEGDRSYPTLAIRKFITPGSWLAWDFNQVWLDLDSSSETWADQP